MIARTMGGFETGVDPGPGEGVVSWWIAQVELADLKEARKQSSCRENVGRSAVVVVRTGMWL